MTSIDLISKKLCGDIMNLTKGDMITELQIRLPTQSMKYLNGRKKEEVQDLYDRAIACKVGEHNLGVIK